MDKRFLIGTTLQGQQPKEHIDHNDKMDLKCQKAVGISAVGLSPADLTLIELVEAHILSTFSYIPPFPHFRFMVNFYFHTLHMYSTPEREDPKKLSQYDIYLPPGQSELICQQTCLFLSRMPKMFAELIFPLFFYLGYFFTSDCLDRQVDHRIFVL